MATDKNQILEPITAIARLIMLAFKPENTKIAIRDHNVVLCENKVESYYGFKIPQAVDRYMNGDSRDDIFILNHVICNFITWYILPNKTKDREIYDCLIKLAKYLRVSLKKLQHTYKTGNVVGTLQYYINVLTDVIEDKFQLNRLYSLTPPKRSSFLDEISESQFDSQDLMYSTILDVNKFKQFWERDEVKKLCEQFDNCFRCPGEPDSAVFREKKTTIASDGGDGLDAPEEAGETGLPDFVGRTGETIGEGEIVGIGIKEDDLIEDDEPKIDKIDKKETKLQKKQKMFTRKRSDSSVSISSTTSMSSTSSASSSSSASSTSSTSSSTASPKTWPIPKSQTNVMVKGYLVCIVKILEIMDARFTTMLSQSIKGIN